MFQPQPPSNGNQQVGMRRQYIAQQQTLPQPATFPPSIGPILPTSNVPNSQTPIPVIPPTTPTPSTPPKKKHTTRMIAVFLVIGLVGAIYVVWHTATPTSTTTTTTSPSANVSQQNFATTGATASQQMGYAYTLWVRSSILGFTH